MAYVKKVRNIANQLLIVDQPIENYNIIMKLLLNIFESGIYLIVALESIEIKELILDYIMIRLVYRTTN